MELGAALAHQDVAGDDGLAAELLDAEAAACGIAAVARRAACFLMRHDLLLIPARDAGDAQHGQMLAMAVLAAVIVAALLLEDDDLSPRGLLDHFGGDRGAGDIGAPARASAPSPPTISTSPRVTVAPGSPASFSTSMTSSLATLYCLPPVRMTANMDLAQNSNGRETRPAPRAL